MLSISSGCQFNQGQHLWCNGLARERYAVGGNLDCGRKDVYGCGQLSQCGSGEQGSHIYLEAIAPHALDQSHRQQGVAAEGEEVVVASDLIELEHLGPDGGQPSLNLALAAARSRTSHKHQPSGAGSALRSSLPLGVSGSDSRRT